MAKDYSITGLESVLRAYHPDHYTITFALLDVWDMPWSSRRARFAVWALFKGELCLQGLGHFILNEEPLPEVHQKD